MGIHVEVAEVLAASFMAAAYCLTSPDLAPLPAESSSSSTTEPPILALGTSGLFDELQLAVRPAS